LYLQEKVGQSTQAGPAAHNLKGSSAALRQRILKLCSVFPTRLAFPRVLPSAKNHLQPSEGSPGNSSSRGLACALRWKDEAVVSAGGWRSAERGTCPRLPVMVSVSPETTTHEGQRERRGSLLPRHLRLLPPRPGFALNTSIFT